MVEIEAFTAPSATSTLDEVFDKLFEAVLIVPRRASTLDEELERARLDV